MEEKVIAIKRKRLRLEVPISILWWNPEKKTFRIEDTIFVGNPYKTIYQTRPPEKVRWSLEGEEMLAYACLGMDGVAVGVNNHVPQDEFYRFYGRLERKYLKNYRRKANEVKDDNVICVNFKK